MHDEGKRMIREMLESGKITQEEADRLLEALGESAADKKEPATPHLTLFPEEETGPDPADAIGEAVEKAVDEAATGAEEAVHEAAEAGEREWDSIGERIGSAVTDRMNALFSRIDSELGSWENENGGEQTAEDASGKGEPYSISLDCRKLDSLSVEWVNGPVELRRSDSGSLVITEYANRPLQDSEKMYVHMDDGDLKIRWSEGRQKRWFTSVFPLSKWLVVELPDDSMTELDDLRIKNVSGSVELSGLHCSDLSVNTVSGAVRAAELTAEDMGLTTVSGSVEAQAIHADDLQIATTSGAVRLKGFSGNDLAMKTVSGHLRAEEIETDELYANSVSGAVGVRLTRLPGSAHLKSVSGRLVLAVPEDPSGFTVGYSAGSGAFSSDFPLRGDMKRRSGRGEWGEGEADISFSTTSGGMALKKA